MQVDPTEEQVLSALWSLMSTNNMMEGRDRRQVKCSPELKNLFGVEAMSLSSLRQRVADHLTPSKAIQIEYSVTNTSFVPTSRYEYEASLTFLCSAMLMAYFWEEERPFYFISSCINLYSQ